MKNLIWIASLTCMAFIVAACNSGSGNAEEGTSEATVANKAGTKTPIPPDVLLVTKPLISGEMYTTPNFKSVSLVSFDTSQAIHVLDTTHTLFVKARLMRDTTTFTGYVSRTILPEETQVH